MTLMNNKERVDSLRREHTLAREEMRVLLESMSEEDAQYLYQNAAEAARK